MLNKPRQRALSCILAFTLMSSMVVSGCSSNGTELTQSSKYGMQDAGTVAAELREKYEQGQAINYTEGENAVARDHQFIISYDFDPIELGMENYTQIASLYYDAELTQPVSSVYDWASEDKKSYSISPWEYPGRAVYTGGVKGYTYGVEGDALRIFDKGPNADWGNTGTMYLATKVDLKTGETLDKPSVQVVTVKGELDTPKLSFEVTEEGLVRFTWDKVKGAEAYYIVEMSADDDRRISSGRLIGQTTDTEWTSETMTNAGEAYSTNKNFQIYSISEDDWLSQPMLDAFKDEHDPAEGAVISIGAKNRFFCVMAVNKKGSSMYSRMLDVQSVAALAPYTLAYNMEKLSEEGFSRYVEGVNMMPSYRWIVMCDGKLSQRLVNYDFDAVVAETQTWYHQEEGSETYEAVPTEVLTIPYTVEGTAFAGTLTISEYDAKNYKTQLKAIEKRQDALRSKTGDVKREITIEGDEETEEAEEDAEAGIVVDGSIVTANSALSEYLALNMLNGNKTVDLSGFPEAVDQEYLVDAWGEAFYQNPLILGVSGARASRDGKTLYLQYEDDQAVRERKQAEINKKVDQVVAEIITDSMTLREKEYAINQYLCDTVTYDYDALDNAAQYDYAKVDSKYYDSFTAYGALINGVGVCASYSASFKLLADAAGLDCVVVTGYLDGSLGHAWNRVSLGDGYWATVDSTNNDMDIIANAILNTPDSAIATTLVEDDLWIMNFAQSMYSNEKDADEYYHVEGLFFDQDAVVDQIVKQLSSGDIAVVRTDYALNDAQFYEIGTRAAEATGNTELAGFYWMGIVVIAKDYSLLG